MDIILKTNPDELSPRCAQNANRGWRFIRIEVLPINTALHQSLYFNRFSIYSMLVLEIESSVNLGFPFDEEEYLIKHSPFINDDLVFAEFAELRDRGDHSDHKAGLILW